MPDNHSSRGIAFKLVCRILLFCGVAGFLTSAFVFLRYRESALNNLDEKLKALAASSARQVDGELLGIERCTRGVADTVALLQPGQDRLGALLVSRVTQMPELFGLAVGMEPRRPGQDRWPTGVLQPGDCLNAWREDGKIGQRVVQFDYPAREWYRLARGGGGWASPYKNIVQDKAGHDVLIVSYGAPILNEKKEFLGAVCADLDMTVLNHIAESARLAGDSYVCIIDRTSHRYLVHPDPGVVRAEKAVDDSEALLDENVRRMGADLLAGNEGRGYVHDLRTKELRRIYYLPLARNNWTLGIIYDEAQITHDLQMLMLQTFSVAVCCFLILSLLVRHAARRITAPLVRLDATAQEIACGKLTAALPEIGDKDEVGRLCGSVRSMARGLITLVDGIKHSTVRLVSAASQIAATSARQEQTMDDFQQEVASVAAAVAEISASARELAGTMQSVNRGAGDAAAQAGSGKESLLALEGSMRSLTNATLSMAGKLELIRQSVENISGIVQAIAEVAEQTNLLSLNASIEAEKAGEYGKGFSVVAREIRRLSDKTSVATVEIGQVAGGMQAAVEAGVAELELFTEAVSRSAAEAAEIGEGLGGVIAQVAGLSPSFLRVNEGMQTQAQGAEEISQAMRRLRAGAEGAAESMNQLNSATEQLREAAALLREETSRFQTE